MHQLVATRADKFPDCRWICGYGSVLHVDHISNEFSHLFVGILIRTDELESLALELVAVLQ
jgi:hypothetical protein